MQKLAALVLVALTSCSSMPDVKVEGVDGLKVTEHVLSPAEVQQHCSEALNTPFFLVILACATIVLETWTCDIYYALETAAFTLEHEREHCRGKWHDSGLQKYYDEWVAGGRKRS